MPHWAAGIFGVLSFIGVLFGYGKLKQPASEPDNNEVRMLAHRMDEMERRQVAMDERLDDVFHLLGDTSRTLAACQVDIREALTRLQERHK